MRTSIGLIEAMIYRTGRSVVLKPGVIWGNHRLGDTTTRPCGWESWGRRSWILVERIPVNVTYKHVDNLNENEGFQVFSRTRLSYLFPPRGRLRIQGDAHRVHQGMLQTRILTTVRAIMADLDTFLRYLSCSLNSFTANYSIICFVTLPTTYGSNDLLRTSARSMMGIPTGKFTPVNCIFARNRKLVLDTIADVCRR